MQGTTGGRQNTPRYYCATRRADNSCDQPIIPAEHVERQLARFLTGFAPNPAIREQILHRLSAHTPETDETAERRDALEERLGRTRDLYELGNLTRPEYIARRDAIHSELASLTPEPLPSLAQASKVLEDFTIFWAGEPTPTPSASSSASSSAASGSTTTASSPSNPSPRSSPSSRTSTHGQQKRRG